PAAADPPPPKTTLTADPTSSLTQVSPLSAAPAGGDTPLTLSPTGARPPTAQVGGAGQAAAAAVPPPGVQSEFGSTMETGGSFTPPSVSAGGVLPARSGNPPAPAGA